MTLTKVKEFLIPSNFILFGLLLFAIFFALRIVHPKILDCSGYIGDPQTLGLILAYVDSLFETCIRIAFFGLFVGGLSIVIGILRYVEKNASVWVIAGTVIVVLVLVAVVASLIIASLNVARSRSPNAGVKAYIAAIRPEGESYVSLHGSYGLPTESCTEDNSFFAVSEVQKYILAAEKISGQPAECRSNGQAFVIAIPLLVQGPSDTGLLCKADLQKRPRWCVDSTGGAREILSSLQGYACPEKPNESLAI